jgi:hypothetical protein
MGVSSGIFYFFFNGQMEHPVQLFVAVSIFLMGVHLLILKFLAVQI